ncbi:MAG: TetR/AcrR family transcriptional regulator [candidate division WOR-3 bacterium]
MDQADKDDKKEKKRQDILDAARKVFSARGYYQATMDEIASEAGVAKGTLYLYYPSKAHLLLACVKEMMDSLAGGMRDMLEEYEGKDVSPVDIIRYAIGIYLNHLNRNKEMLVTAVREGEVSAMEIGGEDLRKEILSHIWGYTEYVSATLEKGMNSGVIRKGNPRIMALGLMGVAQNITMYHLYNEPNKDLTELLEDIVELVKNMILEK